MFVCGTFRDEQWLRFYREWPGRSPTVNVSSFIAKAYLANLYYTQRHYEAALETCNEVVAVYKDSEGNKQFADHTFPVLLTTQWAAVYDKELQALLGLCSLCRFVSNRTDARSVCLAVCPVKFVLYLKLRCAHDQRCWADVRQSASEYDAHVEQCGASLINDRFTHEIFLFSLKLHACSSAVNLCFFPGGSAAL